MGEAVGGMLIQAIVVMLLLLLLMMLGLVVAAENGLVGGRGRAREPRTRLLVPVEGALGKIKSLEVIGLGQAFKGILHIRLGQSMRVLLHRDRVMLR